MRKFLLAFMLLFGLSFGQGPIGPPTEPFESWVTGISNIEFRMVFGAYFENINRRNYTSTNDAQLVEYPKDLQYFTFALGEDGAPTITIPATGKTYKSTITVSAEYEIIGVGIPFDPVSSYFCDIYIFHKRATGASGNVYTGFLTYYSKDAQGNVSVLTFPIQAKFNYMPPAEPKKKEPNLEGMKRTPTSD